MFLRIESKINDILHDKSTDKSINDYNAIYIILNSTINELSEGNEVEELTKLNDIVTETTSDYADDEEDDDNDNDRSKIDQSSDNDSEYNQNYDEKYETESSNSEWCNKSESHSRSESIDSAKLNNNIEISDYKKPDIESFILPPSEPKIINVPSGDECIPITKPSPLRNLMMSRDEFSSSDSDSEIDGRDIIDEKRSVSSESVVDDILNSPVHHFDRNSRTSYKSRNNSSSTLDIQNKSVASPQIASNPKSSPTLSSHFSFNKIPSLLLDDESSGLTSSSNGSENSDNKASLRNSGPLKAFPIDESTVSNLSKSCENPLRRSLTMPEKNKYKTFPFTGV